MISLQFPNISRSFDQSKHRICFWGYDKTIEVTFYVGLDALKKLDQQTGSDESELLAVFDSSLEKIHEVAARVYASSFRGKGTYVYMLNADDF